jgi:hypothetical protein
MTVGIESKLGQEWNVLGEFGLVFKLAFCRKSSFPKIQDTIFRSMIEYLFANLNC